MGGEGGIRFGSTSSRFPGPSWMEQEFTREFHSTSWSSCVEISEAIEVGFDPGLWSLCMVTGALGAEKVWYDGG